MGERSVTRWRRAMLSISATAAVMAAALIGGPGAGAAQAAPSGQPDPGIPFSSVVYGTGCAYSLTVPVNSVGMVSFYEQRKGFPPIFIGKTPAYQLSATVIWVPRHLGDRTLYAVQNGQKSPTTVARVHQGYGSGGLCFAL
ncbi:hypothetical protein ACPXB3_15570 [Gordonia sp. DT219]|uniref:hypothetical protein n=1 Tax=Gordonia sp. DT219 TaxID=3416658 RepID=UPI003CEDF48F